MKLLVADKLSEVGLAYLRQQRVEFDNRPGLSPDELKAIIGNYDGIIIRSGVKITADTLAKPGRLRAIARAGVGVDNVDVPAATSKGVIVMNTPGGNTISTAELTLTLMMALSRKIVPAAVSLTAGKWDRKSFEGTQLSGKTLGVIGLGRIGRTVCQYGRALGMQVMGYDPLLSADAVLDGVERTSDVEAIYERADFITVHVPRTEKTNKMISTAQFEKMKASVRLINAARGGIIDEAALLTALEQGKVAGAALDVYTEEPPKSESLQKLLAHPKLLAVPHLGASTEEAQELVALEAAEIIIEALRGGEIRNAVNVSGGTKVPESLKPYVELAERIGTLLSAITPGAMKKVNVAYRGDIATMDFAAATAALTIGLLRPVLGNELNIVNAPVLAKERNISIDVTTNPDAQDFTNLVEVALTTDKLTRTAVGAIFGRKFPRIVAIDGFSVEMLPEGHIVVGFNDDKPGVIGRVGDACGALGINIAQMTVGRKLQLSKAVLALNLDAEVPDALLTKLSGLEFVREVYRVKLPSLPEAQRQG
jgi:D-3-phosphoglycerate dehydrogenase